MQENLYRDLNSYLRDKFGCRVQKITLDAGLTCPNRDGSISTGGCIYCNPKGSGTGAAQHELGIKEQLESAKAFLRKRYKARKFLAYFQSFSNTYAPYPSLRSMYEQALEVEDVVGLTIGTRPDCVESRVLDYLQDLSTDYLVWMEYGLQSAIDNTLHRINRGHGTAEFEDAVSRTRDRNIPVCAHVILGLPGEGRKEMMRTAEYLNRVGVDSVKVHLLYVVKGTELQRMYEKGEYRCLERQEYVSLVGEFLSILSPQMIVQRLTGDPHKEELVAPEWSLEKQENLLAIHEYLRENGLYQGKNFGGVRD
ncbi:MAG: TIGR01212 family radical SAM protein [Thermodesulfobacteriota bacterium]